MDKNRIIRICAEYQLEQKYDVVIREAYIPYIPPKWNGCLVLGEAQNLSSTYYKYVESLKRMTKQEQITRLKDPSNLGIKPWDEGSLKIAIKAAMDINPNNTAVSNGVLWSQTDGATRNKNPKNSLKKHSQILWETILTELNPVGIIACGAVAQDVIKKTSWAKTHSLIELKHPGAMRYVKKTKSTKDLLEEFPKVRETIQNNQNWFQENKRKAIINYACHVFQGLQRHAGT